MILWNDVALIIQRKRIMKNISLKKAASDLSINMFKYYRIENGVQEPNFFELQLIFEYYYIELIINFP